MPAPSLFRAMKKKRSARVMPKNPEADKIIQSLKGLSGKKGFPTGVTIVDINADGKMDIYICKSGKFSNPNDRIKPSLPIILFNTLVIMPDLLIQLPLIQVLKLQEPKT